MVFIILFMIFFMILSVVLAFIFLKTIFPNLQKAKKQEEGENLVLFKILYSENIYSIWNTNTDNFLTFKTIVNGEEKQFLGLFDSPQNVYSLFDKGVNPWRNSYKIVKISRNKLLSEKFCELKLDCININGKLFMDYYNFEKAEKDFYRSILDGRLDGSGLTIGEDIFNAVEGEFFYIECY